MAAGTLTVFNEAKQNIANGTLNLSSATDFYCMLITTLPTAADLTPDSSDYTEVSGAGYTAGGVQLNVTWNESAGTVTFDSSVDPAWTQNASGPTNIVAALIYSSTAAAEDALCFIDMTADGGTTPISLVDGDISITFAATGLFTLA
jgi:hypothetical protein